MAGLWWMTVMLVFFSSVGRLDAVDKNKLAELIQAVKKAYQPPNVMFSLALSIKSEDPDNVKRLLKDNPKDKVHQKLSTGAVYSSQSLAVAKVQKRENLPITDHAEFRVLQNLKLASNVGDLLVIYSYASSCPEKCTNMKSKYNIINKIKEVIKGGKWSRHVFVFEKVFKPSNNPPIDEKILEESLKELGKSGIPLANIFRCYKQNYNFQCTSCARGTNVEKKCVDYNQ